MVLPPRCGRRRTATPCQGDWGCGRGWGREGRLRSREGWPLPVPRQLRPLLIYCRPQKILSTAMSSTGPGRVHAGFRTCLRRRTQPGTREPRPSISPPSPSLPRASSFPSTNPAPGPGPATPSLPTVSLSRAPGGRDRPHAKRDPGSRKRLWRPLRTQNGPGQELCEGVAVSIRRGGVRQLQAEINDMTQGLLIKAPLNTVYGAQGLSNSTCDLLLNHTPSSLGILGGASP